MLLKEKLFQNDHNIHAVRGYGATPHCTHYVLYNIMWYVVWVTSKEI